MIKNKEIDANPLIKSSSKKEKKLVRNNLSSEKKTLKVDFSHFLFPNISLGAFTNYLTDRDECLKKLKAFYHQVLPYINGKTFQELEKENKHCHSINGKKEKFLIVKILKKYKEIYEEFSLPNYEEFLEDFYQLHGPNGLRLIGLRISNSFILLFIDFHHLIYPNIKHNDYDYIKNNCEIAELFSSKENITILSFENKMLENPKCLDCEELDKLLK